MATTVAVAELTVTVTESYTLNGVNYGNITNQLFVDNGKVLQRIMVASTSDPAILNFGTLDAEGQVMKGDFVYFRVTNLDNKNFVMITLYNGADSFFYKLKAGDSLLLMDNEMDAIDASTTFGAFADITQIKADADTAECSVEFFAVTL
tara:strand:+ start:533 stop:979 length:447 start_codon:yes stop_codon:yes gene_type:complete